MTTRLSVPAEAAGQRLDRHLANCGGHGTRSQVLRLIEAGRVRLNGKLVKAGTMLRTGDVLEVDEVATAAAAPGPEPQDIPLEALYEDEDLLVIAKPAGLVVHPAPGHWGDTLVSALLFRWQGQRAGLDPLRPGIVHRLDRETSGVLVIGKTADVVMRLSAQFRARKVAKEYVAVVWRCPRERSGLIDRPIGRHPTQRKQMAIRDRGRVAVTRYEVSEEFGDVTLLRVRPETGRTHQIRVHLAALGHPIVGDKVYGRTQTVKDEVLRTFPRHALHASRLEFEHPRSLERMRFEAPFPLDLQALLTHLRGRVKAGIGGGFA